MVVELEDFTRMMKTVMTWELIMETQHNNNDALFVFVAVISVIYNSLMCLGKGYACLMGAGPVGSENTPPPPPHKKFNDMLSVSPLHICACELIFQPTILSPDSWCT